MPARELRAYAHAMIHSAALWDILGVAGALPPWWPPVSYGLVGAGVAAACLSVLFVTLTARRHPQSTAVDDRAAAPGTRRGSAGQLLATGILLTGWILRGHAEIPPDVPIVAAQVAGAALYAFFTLRYR